MIVFISGTGTDVGKTYITAQLAGLLKQLGVNVLTQKWVQSGSVNYEDLHKHLDALNLNMNDVKSYISAMVPYQFSLPASPHLAAKAEAKSINPDKLLVASDSLSKQCDVLLVEGSGGLMVPLNDQVCIIDLLEQRKYHTLLVADNCLGSINHTLLSIEALRQRQIPILSVVFNNVKNITAPEILLDNPKIVHQLTGINPCCVSYQSQSINQELNQVVQTIINSI